MIIWSLRRVVLLAPACAAVLTSAACNDPQPPRPSPSASSIPGQTAEGGGSKSAVESQISSPPAPALPPVRVPIRPIPAAPEPLSSVVGLIPATSVAEAGTTSSLTLSGTYEYAADTFIDVTSLTIVDGTSLRVRNGATLTIIAEALDMGDAVAIDLTGEPGPVRTDRPAQPPDWTSGGDCPGGPPWRNCDPGRKAHLQWEAAVNANRNGTNNNVDRGAPGYPGHGGGSGGTLRMIVAVVWASPDSFATLSAVGGKRGPGGQGGPGRMLRCGHASSDIWQAASGPPGGEGPLGKDGRIELHTTGPLAGVFLTSAKKVAKPQPSIAEDLAPAEWAKRAGDERKKHQPGDAGAR